MFCRKQVDLAQLPEDRDCLVNVDALGRPTVVVDSPSLSNPLMADVARRARRPPAGPRFAYDQWRSGVTRFTRGARLALRDLYEAHGRRLARRRRRPRARP